MKIKDLIIEVLVIEEGTEITDDTRPEDIDSWDSLGHVNLIVAIEDEFNVEISPEEIGEIKSVSDIKVLLLKKDINPE